MNKFRFRNSAFRTKKRSVVYAANIAVPGYSTLPPIYYNLSS